MNVPLNRDAVRDAMPAFFDLLRKEPHPSFRVVLGHFIFVYIHAYMEWQRLPDRSRKSECRRVYRALRGLPRRALVKKRLAGEPLPAVPKALLLEER